jgi:Spy/CpxP family protein refolding chaperone
MKGFGIALLLLAFACLATDEAFAQRHASREVLLGNDFGSDANLLDQQSVRSELKLTDEQVTEIAKHIETKRAASEDLNHLTREQWQSKIADILKADNAIEAVLKEDQLKRLKQVSLQERGPTAWGDPEVATILNLTSDQKAQVKDVYNHIQGQLHEVFQGGSREIKKRRNKIEEARNDFNEKAQAILTTEQKEKLKALAGQPFNGKIVKPFRVGLRLDRPLQE